MLLKDEFSEKSGALSGIAILVIGVAIGLVISPGAWLESVEARPDSDLDEALEDPGNLVTGDDTAARPENDLDTLDFIIKPNDVVSLREARQKAMATGRIIREESVLVPSTIHIDGREYPAEVRLKGDLIDHVDTDRWSLRVELTDQPLFGMSRFSIQHPKTRNYLPGWLVLEAARYEGLIAPRASYVNVEINGQPYGIYELEEHISKELLESQGRREGPVVTLAEGSSWSLASQVKSATPRQGPTRRIPGAHVYNAPIGVYGEGHLAGSESLSREMQSAISKLRDLQRHMVMRSRWGDFLGSLPFDYRGARQVEAHRYITQNQTSGATAGLSLQLQTAPQIIAETAAEILSLDRVAQATAIMSLFGGSHGLAWHNTRYYLDPTRDRLELVLFDIDPSITHGWTVDPFIWDQRWVGNLLKNHPDYYLEVFRELHELTSPEWLAEFMAHVDEELTRYGNALASANDLPPGEDVDSIRTHLQNRQIYLRNLLVPTDCIHFHSSIELDGDAPTGEMVIEAWVATRVPVTVDGFRFSNGRLLAAAQVLDPQMSDGAVETGDGITMPWDARRVRFRFPFDERIATLREIDQITDAILQADERDRATRLEVVAEYHLTGSGEERSELLNIHRYQRSWGDEASRPSLPDLEDALDKHPFLRYDIDTGSLYVERGTWDVEADLVVPAGLKLRVGPGVTLRFEENAILYSESALLFDGVEQEPVRLEPQDAKAGWTGVTVLEAEERSVWFHVHVSGAKELMRGGWLASGGVNFYRSPVEIRSSTISDARGEDALNVLGAEVLLDEVTITGAVSDAFDGDFVTGLVRKCDFTNIGGDGVDTSGSRLRVEDCTFDQVGDKAISGGESSEITVTGGVVRSASIGVASKDGSWVTVEGLRILRATHYGMTAYIKKPEYPPSRITAVETEIVEAGLGAHLVQTGCTLVFDGEEQPSEDIDVDALYEQGILGN